MPLQPVVVRVRTYELDSFGHVNNAVYLNYLEEARSEYLRQLDLSFNDFTEFNVQLVIVEAQIRYISAARYGDEIAIEAAFRDIGPVSLYIDYRLTIAATGRLLATATTKGAFIDATTTRPTRAPKPFRDAFLDAATAPAA